MTKDILMDAIGFIDENTVMEFINTDSSLAKNRLKATMRRKIRTRWIATAVCVTLIMGGLFGIGPVIKNISGSSTTNSPNVSTPSEITEPPAKGTTPYSDSVTTTDPVSDTDPEEETTPKPPEVTTAVSEPTEIYYRWGEMRFDIARTLDRIKLVLPEKAGDPVTVSVVNSSTGAEVWSSSFKEDDRNKHAYYILYAWNDVSYICHWYYSVGTIGLGDKIIINYEVFYLNSDGSMVDKGKVTTTADAEKPSEYGLYTFFIALNRYFTNTITRTGYMIVNNIEGDLVYSPAEELKKIDSVSYYTPQQLLDFYGYKPPENKYLLGEKLPAENYISMNLLTDVKFADGNVGAIEWSVPKNSDMPGYIAINDITGKPLWSMKIDNEKTIAMYFFVRKSKDPTIPDDILYWTLSRDGKKVKFNDMIVTIDKSNEVKITHSINITLNFTNNTASNFEKEYLIFTEVDYYLNLENYQSYLLIGNADGKYEYSSSDAWKDAIMFPYTLEELEGLTK